MPTMLLPPRGDGVYGKFRSIRGLPNHNNSTIKADIIDTIRRSYANSFGTKIMIFDFFRFASPYAALIFEQPDSFLLFRVHGQSRFATVFSSLHARVDVLKLGVAVWVLLSLTCLAVALQAVPQFGEQTANSRGTDFKPLAS